MRLRALRLPVAAESPDTRRVEGHHLADLDQAKAEYHQLMATAGGRVPDTATVADWMPRWRAYRDGSGGGPRRTTPTQPSGRHILPYFGDWKMIDVRYDDVVEFRHWMTEHGAGNSAQVFAADLPGDHVRVLAQDRPAAALRQPGARVVKRNRRGCPGRCPSRSSPHAPTPGRSWRS